jgi:hypothetical protein
MLNNNRIGSLDSRATKYLETLRNFSIGGDGNHFKCRCGEEKSPIQKWLLRKDIREKVMDIDRVLCMLPNNKTVRIVQTDENAVTDICRENQTNVHMDEGESTPQMDYENDKETVEEHDMSGMKDEEYMEEEATSPMDDTWTTTTTSAFIPTFVTSTEQSHEPLPSLPGLEEHAIRVLAKIKPTKPTRRRDFDSQVAFKVLLLILVLVLVFLICAIATTVYYRLEEHFIPVLYYLYVCFRLVKPRGVKTRRTTRITFDEGQPLRKSTQ